MANEIDEMASERDVKDEIRMMFGDNVLRLQRDAEMSVMHLHMRGGEDKDDAQGFATAFKDKILRQIDEDNVPAPSGDSVLEQALNAMVQLQNQLPDDPNIIGLSLSLLRKFIKEWFELDNPSYEFDAILDVEFRSEVILTYSEKVMIFIANWAVMNFAESEE